MTLTDLSKSKNVIYDKKKLFHVLQSKKLEATAIYQYNTLRWGYFARRGNFAHFLKKCYEL